MKKETLAQVFSCEFCEIFKNTFFYRTTPVASVHRWLPISPNRKGRNKSGGWKIFHAQPAIACSKSTIETLEQGVKYVQS